MEKYMYKVMDPVLTAVAQVEHPQVHFVDIENLVGVGKLDAYSVRQARRQYEQAVKPKSTDIIVVAAGPQNRSAVYEGWDNAIYQWRKGKDGADLALLELFESLREPTSFAHVFVGSGDGGLSPVAEMSREQGIPVTVVARINSCSWKLKSFEVISLEGADL
jgi:hypothetical protein